MRRGMLVVVSGPSGVGKGTICERILARDRQLTMSVSATTRSPRAGETEGEDYFFKTVDEFEGMITRGELLEYMHVFGLNYYGTPLSYVESQRTLGKDVILEIEVNGAEQVKQAHPDALTIFIMPPSKEALLKRLTGRGTEAHEVVARRIQEADAEMEKARQYDYIVVNDDLETAVCEVLSILEAERGAN